MFHNPKKINIILFGTSNFAATILKQLLNTKHLISNTIITQPDKPVGRKKILTPSPVKKIAQQHNLNILQPEKLDINFYNTLKSLDAELFIVVAYGKIIPENIIELPFYKTINIHPSLLPAYRGPSPIQSALLNDESQTGTSIMLIDKKMDHGNILAQLKFPISKNDIYPTLAKKIAEQSANLLIKTIPEYINKKIKPQPQNHSQATFSKIITKKDGLITADKTAREIYNMYRAYTPWPGIYNQLTIKFLDIKTTELKHNQQPLNLFTENNNLYLACANHTTLQINQLQLPGKKPLDAKSYINGYMK